MAANNNLPRFWTISEDTRGRKIINIIKVLYIDFLEKKGYRKLRYGKDFQLVLIENNSILSAVEPHYIREDIRKHLNSLDKKEVLEVFLGADYLSKKYTESLSSINISFNHGNDSTAVFFYKNGVLEVDKEDVKLIPYTSFEGYIWKDQISDRVFISQEFEECEFGKFLFNVSGRDIDRLTSLQTIIGYLLHTYKDPALTKAIIFIDEKMDNTTSQGGTGKTVIADAIKQMVSTLKKDGKLLKSNDKFFFAEVEPHHNVVIFDDVKRDFLLEDLYSVLTGDMRVEKKYKNPEIMDFKDVPKVMITSNYVVSGTGGHSESRRKVVFEVGPYYRETTSILDEFGHRFFEDWSDTEWLKFDNYMINCVQKYLREGLLEAKPINILENTLALNTDRDFVSFMDNIISNPINNGGVVCDDNCRFDRSALYNDFLTQNPELQNLVTQNKFKKWIQIYCENRNIKFRDQKSNGKCYTNFQLEQINENHSPESEE